MLLWSVDETMTSPVAFDSGASGTSNFARIKSISRHGGGNMDSDQAKRPLR